MDNPVQWKVCKAAGPMLDITRNGQSPDPGTLGTLNRQF